MSGGTDICGCFVLGIPTKPVDVEEIQGPALGFAVEVFDDAGRRQAHGKGELVCTKPFPSMPIGFWNDPGDKKYHATYFARFPNVWHHGDFAEWTEHGGMVIHGRSDATLNPGGVRIGTAEIYRVVERVHEVEESVAIGQLWPPDHPTDTRVVLFVRLRPGYRLDESLESRIRSEIRRQASPRHVPARIVQVPDIPRTKNGKVVELAVKAVVHGMPLAHTDALANPEALEHFKDLAELAS
jgi:acetoacetyl-CoA synthetase